MAARKNNEVPAPSAKAAAQEGYTRLVSPAGAVSIVPDAILEALLESGYTEV